MIKKINATGVACPKPVLQIKNLLEAGVRDTLEILVDNFPAKENVVRFIKNFGGSVLEILEKDGLYTIIADCSTVDIKVSKLNASPQVLDSMGSKLCNYVISSSGIGHGDDTLGKKLMMAFFSTLIDADKIPDSILFMNSGVFHCIENADALPILKKLEVAGVSIIVCGTCTDFLKVTDKLRIGKLSNMYDIVSLYTSGKRIITI